MEVPRPCLPCWDLALLHRVGPKKGSAPHVGESFNVYVSSAFEPFFALKLRRSKRSVKAPRVLTVCLSHTTLLWTQMVPGVRNRVLQGLMVAGAREVRQRKSKKKKLG